MGETTAAASRARIRAGQSTLPAEENDAALDVAELVRRAAEGDRWAWERLVDQYSRLIWAVTRDFKLLESDAGDVFQLTWLRLLTHINKLEKPDRVGAWLAATARNECLRCLAARKKVMLARMTRSSRRRPHLCRKLTRACSPPSARKWFATPWPNCPGGGSECLSC